MISGDDRDENLILKSFAANAVDFMIKPFKAVEILARLEKRLEDTSPLKYALDAGRFARAGNICLDVESHEVFFKGEKLTRLSPILSSLLYVFIRQPDTVFQKASLYAKAWPMQHKPSKDLRVVDKAIERLKKQLGPEVSQLLETVPSAGYRLILTKQKATSLKSP
jgi:DNA-binding response OmpR family regulator